MLDYKLTVRLYNTGSYEIIGFNNYQLLDYTDGYGMLDYKNH